MLDFKKLQNCSSPEKFLLKDRTVNKNFTESYSSVARFQDIFFFQKWGKGKCKKT